MTPGNRVYNTMIHYEVRIKSDWKIDMPTAYVSKLDTTDEHNNNNNTSYIR